MSGPRCTVIVATYNRSHLLTRLLTSLEEQIISRDEFEVVVVDDGSTDDTRSVLDRAGTSFSLRVYSQENQGPGGARNLAIKEAAADIILSLDDDVVAAPDLLAQHLALHESRDHLAATGVMVLPPDRRLAPWLEWEAATLENQYTSMRRGLFRPTPRQFYTANASFRRQDAIAAGLFDPRFRRAEDVEFAYRLQDGGVRFVFLPNAVVYHAPNRTYPEWLRVPWLYGLYDVTMSRDKGRPGILDNVSREFSYRPKPLRLAARHLVGRGRLMDAFIFGAGIAARGVSRIGMAALAHDAYGAIFNLRYWQGVAENLGGREAFWSLISSHSGKAEQRAGKAVG